jgi:hypothetical protein
MSFPSRVAVSELVILPKEAAADVIAKKLFSWNKADGVDKELNSRVFAVGVGLNSELIADLRCAVVGVENNSFVFVLLKEEVGVGVIVEVGSVIVRSCGIVGITLPVVGVGEGITINRELEFNSSAAITGLGKKIIPLIIQANKALINIYVVPISY